MSNTSTFHCEFKLGLNKNIGTISFKRVKVCNMIFKIMKRQIFTCFVHFIFFFFKYLSYIVKQYYQYHS